jgi:zinc transport system substrate-binding protein
MLTLVVMKRVALLAVTTMFTASACAASDSGVSMPRGSDPIRVVSAFYPLAYLAHRIGGEQVIVQNLTQPGAEPHDLELRPKQIAAVADADVVVYEKGFQPAVDEAIEQNRPNAVVEVTDVVPLEDTGTAHSEDTANADAHAGHGHQSLAGDPHVWLDPIKFGRIAEAVADTLKDVRPDVGVRVDQRLDAVKTELAQLDNDYARGLAGCQRRIFVTSHGAFGYLAQRYDLDMVAITGLEPDAEPSPARLKEIQQVIRDTGVTTIFTERLVSPKLAQTLATDMGVSTAVLDPIEGLTQQTANEDYLSLMRANLTALQTANACP